MSRSKKRTVVSTQHTGCMHAESYKRWLNQLPERFLCPPHFIHIISGLIGHQTLGGLKDAKRSFRTELRIYALPAS
ncbi:hypothetical protein TMEN_841 [Trichophyton mentagrophytes]|nr:hypothetical protein TMEN_841 [Trichophyton mentagrophytes]